jgi:hypothetical protein
MDIDKMLAEMRAERRRAGLLRNDGRLNQDVKPALNDR